MDFGTGSADEEPAAVAIPDCGVFELAMAATVEGCEESTDVAMSSNLDVAASSLQES